MLAAPCDICSRAEELKACWRCGKRACHRHLDEKTGLCSECKAELGPAKKKRKRLPQEGEEPSDLTVPPSARPTRVHPGMIKKMK
jgi:hypothetical protein